MNFPHLQLRDWPFVVVPRPEACDYLADREQLKDDVTALVAGLKRRDASSIHVFWAWFGAGKTHTLYYIRNLAQQERDEFGRLNGLIPVYTELPRAPGGFLDVYKAFATALDPQQLADAFLELHTSPRAAQLREKMRTASVDMENALKTLATGKDKVQDVAKRWLRGDRLPVAEFRTAGIAKAIASPEEAVQAFSIVIETLAQGQVAKGARVGRVVWLLDEFQRISAAPPKVLSEINAGLHSAFNACPAGLTLVISFSGRPDNKLPKWFSPELRDRIGITKVMVLPPLDINSSLAFLRDVLAHHRAGDVANPYFPFSPAACERVIAWISESSELKPRAIMQAFNQILESADLDIEAGQLSIINEEYVVRILDERITLAEESYT